MGEITPKNEGNVGSHGREYLHTFPIECGHFSPNVDNYTIHGSYGNYTRWAQKAAVISIEFYMVPIDTIINWCQWGEKKPTYRAYNSIYSWFLGTPIR